MNWAIYALLSAFFASLVAIFGKIGIKDVDSNLAVAIRTIIIVFFAWGVVLFQGNVNVNLICLAPLMVLHLKICKIL